MKIKIDPRDIPRWTDEECEPTDLGNGMRLELKVEPDYDAPAPWDWEGQKIIFDRGPEELWDELLEAIGDDVLQPFQSYTDYGHEVETDDFDFFTSGRTEPPGVYIDDEERGYRDHRWLEPSRESGYTDEERQRFGKLEAERIYGYLHDLWCYVYLTASIKYEEREIGFAGATIESDYDDVDRVEVVLDLVEQAWASVQAELARTGAWIAKLQNIPEIGEEVEAVCER